MSTDAPGLEWVSSKPEVEWPLGPGARCMVVHSFLSAAECDALILSGEHKGFAGANPDYPPSYRDNDRLVTDDPVLAGALFQRLMQGAGESAAVDAMVRESGWSVLGVNERIRFCRYRPGTQFGAHQDGVHYRASAQSRLTFMVYLNDEPFTGGDTVFFAHRADAMAGANPIARLRPRKGSLILFDHALWHAGARVESGVKYVMRSDLMYAPDDRCETAGPFEPGHRGFVWALTRLGDSTIASAGRDAAIRIWNYRGDLLASLVGHTQSVLGVLETAPGELVSHSRDRTVRRWCTASGASQIIGTSEAAVLSAGLLGPRRLVTGDAAGKLTVWDLQTNLSTVRAAHESWIWAIATREDGTFATASEDGWVRLWDSAGSEVVAGIDLVRPLRTVAIHDGPQGRLVAAGDIAGQMHILDAAHGLAPLRSFDAHEGSTRKVRFEEHQILLTCGEDGYVRRWELASGRNTVIAVHDNFATDVLSLGEGRWISCGYDGQIRIGSAAP